MSYSRTGTVAFLFKRNLYLTGDGTAPYSLSLDFGDGNGYRSAAWNQPLSTTYASPGTKRVKIRLVYLVYGQYAETRESWFDLRVFATPQAVAYRTASGNNGAVTAAYPPTVPPGSTEGFDMVVAPTSAGASAPTTPTTLALP